MFLFVEDVRNVPYIFKISRNPADEPLETDLRNIYMCDGCGEYLYDDWDIIYQDKFGDIHFCEVCVVGEFGMKRIN